MIRLLLLITLLFSSGSVFSGNSSERIKGVADFLIDRANANYFYIFEHAIANNQSLKCYFPDTYEHAQSGNLRALLQTTKVWQDTIENDLRSIVTTSVSKPFAQVLESSSDIRNYYINLLQVLAVEIEGEAYGLNVIPLDADTDTRQKINQFSINMSASLDGFDLIRNELEDFKKPCYRSRWSLETTREKINLFKIAIGHANTQLDLLKDNHQRLTFNKAKLQDFCSSNSSLLCQSGGEFENLVTPRRAGRSIGGESDIEVSVRQAKSTFELELINGLAKINQLLASIDAYLFEIENKVTVTAKAISALRLIEQSGLKTEKMDKLRRHVLFFSQVADATEATEVKALLSAYTLPAVSFFVKREPGNSHWLISAWLGAGITEVTSGEERTDTSIYTPLGLEYSWGLEDRSSISVMLAPFDFGYPVSLKLNGLDDDVEFDEIVAPSLALAYGFKDYPLSTGIAYQKGRKIADADEAENGVVLFLVFDMPLWTLH